MFIKKHRQEFDVTMMGWLLIIPRSGYYVWQQWQLSTREMVDVHLTLNQNSEKKT